MRINCFHCGAVLTNHATPPNMRHEDKENKQIAFTAYLHCKQCGCTVSARIFLKVAREPFDKNKIQEK
jgi:hypothetical protein